MIFDLRSMVLGMALGLIIGVYISPSIDSPKIQSLSSDGPAASEIVEQQPTRPSDPAALVAIFEAQGWDFQSQGAGAAVDINRCAPSLAKIVCDLTLTLPWVDKPQNARVEFGKDGDVWIAGKMKTIAE